jgi:hypothetical protein
VAAGTPRLSDPGRGSPGPHAAGGLITPPPCPENRVRFIGELTPTRPVIRRPQTVQRSGITSDGHKPTNLHTANCAQLGKLKGLSVVLTSPTQEPPLSYR